MNGPAEALGMMFGVYFLAICALALWHCGLDGACLVAAVDCAFGWCHR